MYENLILDSKRHIGFITLNRPKVLNAIDEKTFHELRKDFKNYRYTVEIFSSIFNINKSEIMELKLIQDHLGKIQDYSNYIRYLQKYLKNHEEEKKIFNAVIKELEIERKNEMCNFIECRKV